MMEAETRMPTVLNSSMGVKKTLCALQAMPRCRPLSNIELGSSSSPFQYSINKGIPYNDVLV